MHYFITGGASLERTVRKQEFLIPVVPILRALSNISSNTDIGGITDQ